MAFVIGRQLMVEVVVANEVIDNMKKKKKAIYIYFLKSILKMHMTMLVRSFLITC